MEVNVPSQFLNVVLTEEQENCSVSNTIKSYKSDEIKIKENAKPKKRSPPPLLPLPKSTIKRVYEKEWIKEKDEKCVWKRNGLSDQEKWDLTKHLPKTLLAECTIEIHSSPLNRFEKAQQELCFDARVSPIFNKPPAEVLSERDKQIKFVPSKTCTTKFDQNGDTEDEDQEMNNAFELIEAVYSDHESEDEAKTESELHDSPHPYLDKLIKSEPLSQKHSALTSVGNTPKINFKCEHCPNVYPNRGALWQHTVATHSVEKNCECKICGRKFYRNCSLALHLKSHSEEESCACKECGKSFSRLINLERHMKVHTGAEQIQCEHCEKTFCDRNNLLRHIVCHLSPTARSYQCDICSKSYKSEDHLEIHYQTAHASISCSVCEKSFSTLAELSLHDATHGFEQRFVCKFCNKLFSQKAVLRKHLTIHIGEKLKCNTCGIEFTQRSSLLRHLKRMHCSSSQIKNNVTPNVPVDFVCKTIDIEDCNSITVNDDVNDKNSIKDNFIDNDIDNCVDNDNINNDTADPYNDQMELVKIIEVGKSN